jgi:hypothetical protein
MWTSHQRKELSKDGNVFPNRSKFWLWKTMPNNLGNILVFVTFGMLAPLLAFLIGTALFAEVYIMELVMGRFLVREISVLSYSRRNMPMVEGFKYERVAISTDPRIHKQAEDVDEHWGATAAVEEVTKLCEEVPLSIFPSSRVVLLLLTASVLSFLLNDVINSSGNPYESIYLPSVLVMTFPLVSIAVVKLYKWNSQDASKGNGGVELTDVAPTKMKVEEANNPIHP